MQKSNITLTTDVLEELAFDPSVDARKITVSATDGAVTLSGTVPSYPQKLAAERAVKRVLGVHGIAEELKIELAASHQRNDSDIVSAALDALRWNTTVPRDAVTVAAQGGWLTLSGVVDWEFEREAARHAVSSLAGVLGVFNDLTLRSRVATKDVKAQIVASFRRSAEIDAERIAVEASGGTVTLRGTVHSWLEREDARMAAYSTPGVLKVENFTTVA